MFLLKNVPRFSLKNAKKAKLADKHQSIKKDIFGPKKKDFPDKNTQSKVTTKNVAIAKKSNDVIDSREAMNSQNQENVLSMESSNNNSKRKEENIIGGENISCYNSIPKCIVNMMMFPERSKRYVLLIKEDGHLVDLQEFQKAEKITVSNFMVDNPSCNICRFKKDIIKSLTHLGDKGKGYFMWDIVLPTPADCKGAFSRELITKEHIISTEYEGR